MKKVSIREQSDSPLRYKVKSSRIKKQIQSKKQKRIKLVSSSQKIKKIKKWKDKQKKRGRKKVILSSSSARKQTKKLKKIPSQKKIFSEYEKMIKSFNVSIKKKNNSVKLCDKKQLKKLKKIENLFEKCVKDSIKVLTAKEKKKVVLKKVQKKKVPKRIQQRKKRKLTVKRISKKDKEIKKVEKEEEKVEKKQEKVEKNPIDNILSTKSIQKDDEKSENIPDPEPLPTTAEIQEQDLQQRNPTKISVNIEEPQQNFQQKPENEKIIEAE